MSLASPKTEEKVFVNEPLVPIPAADPNRFLLAKNFQFYRTVEFGELDYLAVDTFLDAKDTVNNWCVGQVKNVNPAERTVIIAFDGWSSKYDIELKRNSTKIAPFRTHTVGYTGQTSAAIRDFKFNQTYLSLLENKIDEIISTEFRCFPSAYECTQFIRGELYFYVDSLLTLQNQTTQEDLPAILNFMESVFKLMIKWYQLIPSYVPAWREAVVTPNLFNVDLSAAISLCCYEISQIFGKLFGICKRSKNFWAKYKQDYIFEGIYYQNEKATENGFLASLVNKFGHLGGFDRLVTLTRRSDMPLNITTQVLKELKYIHAFLEPSLTKEFSQNIKTSLCNRLQNIQHLEMRETDREIMHKAVNCVENFTRNQDSQTQPGQISEILELKIAL